MSWHVSTNCTHGQDSPNQGWASWHQPLCWPTPEPWPDPLSHLPPTMTYSVGTQNTTECSHRQFMYLIWHMMESIMINWWRILHRLKLLVCRIRPHCIVWVKLSSRRVTRILGLRRVKYYQCCDCRGKTTSRWWILFTAADMTCSQVTWDTTCTTETGQTWMTWVTITTWTKWYMYSDNYSLRSLSSCSDLMNASYYPFFTTDYYTQLLMDSSVCGILTRASWTTSSSPLPFSRFASRRRVCLWSSSVIPINVRSSRVILPHLLNDWHPWSSKFFE